MPWRGITSAVSKKPSTRASKIADSSTLPSFWKKHIGWNIRNLPSRKYESSACGLVCSSGNRGHASGRPPSKGQHCGSFSFPYLGLKWLDNEVVYIQPLAPINKLAERDEAHLQSHVKCGRQAKQCFYC